MDPHEEHLDAFEDEEEALDYEDGLVTCVSCGHPNLAFRNHCRRCGDRLHSTSNLIPGVNLVEWTSTDGPRRQMVRQGMPHVLSWLLGITSLPLLWIGIITGSPVFLLLSGILIGMAVLSLSRSRRAAEELKASAPEDAGFPCPHCGGPLAEWDDICPLCGEVVTGDAD